MIREITEVPREGFVESMELELGPEGRAELGWERGRSSQRSGEDAGPRVKNVCMSVWREDDEADEESSSTGSARFMLMRCGNTVIRCTGARFRRTLNTD